MRPRIQLSLCLSLGGLHELFGLLAPAAPLVAVLPHVAHHLGALLQELGGVVRERGCCRRGGVTPFRGELLGDGALQIENGRVIRFGNSRQDSPC